MAKKGVRWWGAALLCASTDLASELVSAGNAHLPHLRLVRLELRLLLFPDARLLFFPPERSLPFEVVLLWRFRTHERGTHALAQ